MPGFTTIALSVVLLGAFIALGALLRVLGVLKAEHGQVLAGLVTRVTLPALILGTLAKSALETEDAALAGIMFLAECACMALALVAARLLRLDRPKTGAFALAATFGSSTMLGYVLVAQLFPHRLAAMTEAVLVSELGVGPALLSLGVMLAAYFGSGKVGTRVLGREALAYFRSPIFLALAAGVALALAGFADMAQAAGLLDRLTKIPAAANAFLVLLTVGLCLNAHELRRSLAPMVAGAAILLVVQPLIVSALSAPLALAPWQREVLVLQSSMPSALLSVPISMRYGLDAALAAKLILATSALSVVTTPLILTFIV